MPELTVAEYEASFNRVSRLRRILQADGTRSLLEMLFGFILSGTCSGICAAGSYKAAGSSMGLFIGSFLLLSLCCPGLIAAEKNWRNILCAAVGLVAGTSAIWIIASMRSGIPAGMIFRCVLILASFVMAMTGIVTFCKRLIGPIAAGAITTVLLLAWISWPIWLSPALHSSHGEEIASWLVPAHPIFVCNGVLIEIFDNWAQQPMSYNLTNLGDDIFFTVPKTIWKCLILHGGIGSLLMLASRRPNSLHHP